MRNTILILMILFLFVGCEQDPNAKGETDANGNPISDSTGVPVSGGKTYTIKAGDHYQGLSFSIAPRSQYGWQVYFFEDTIYTSKDPVNQFDINKLIGTTDCWSVNNHKNSARFGWNWDPASQLMKLHAYTYVDGERQYAFIKSIPVKTVATLSLSVSGYFYTFQVDDVTVKMPRHCDNKNMIGVGQFPYFGGDETAPHDMRIWLKDI